MIDCGVVQYTRGSKINNPETPELRHLFISSLDGFAYMKLSDGTTIPFPVSGGPPSGAAGGDLSGNYPNPNVAKIANQVLLGNAPSVGDVLRWNNATSKWEAGAAPLSGAAGGDLTGSYPDPTIAKLQGMDLFVVIAAQDDVLTWDGVQWLPIPTNVRYKNVTMADAVVNDATNTWNDGFYRVTNIVNNSNITCFYSRTYSEDGVNFKLNPLGFCEILLSDATTKGLGSAILSMELEKIVELNYNGLAYDLTLLSNQTVKLSENTFDDVSQLIMWGDSRWNNLNLIDPTITLVNPLTNYISSAISNKDTIVFTFDYQYIHNLNEGSKRTITLNGNHSGLDSCIVQSDQTLSLSRESVYQSVDFSKGYLTYKAYFDASNINPISPLTIIKNDFILSTDFTFDNDAAGSFKIDASFPVFDQTTWITTISPNNGIATGQPYTFSFEMVSNVQMKFYTINASTKLPANVLTSIVLLEFQTQII